MEWAGVIALGISETQLDVYKSNTNNTLSKDKMNIYKEEDQPLKTNNIVQYQSNDLLVLGRYKTEKKKNYLVVECGRCNQDIELFITGKFFIDEKSFRLGRIPCGCSLSPQWEEWQYKILMKRRAGAFNYTFLGWASEYKSSKTSSSLYCSKHDLAWVSACVNDCRRYDIVCPSCHSDKMSDCTRKPDGVMIQSFLSSGSFAAGTSFVRSDKRAKNGYREYWDVNCPECKTTFTSNYKNLAQGFRGCDCSGYRQKQIYLHILSSNENPVAIKVGIANDWRVRLKTLKARNKLDIENYAVWEFGTSDDCHNWEYKIKSEFPSGFVTKAEMPDGHTETFSLQHLGSIVNLLDCAAQRNTHIGP